MGTIITDSKSYIKVAAQDFLLNITELQIEGKKKMKTEEFLRGNKFQQLLLN